MENKGEVLVIDDNDPTRDILKVLLESEGYAVDSCASGRAALDLTKERPFGIYVVDYRMPEMNGDAVTVELRKLSPGAFIVGFSIENKEREFLSAGANTFITKDRLNKELVQLIKGKQSS